jgi:hypothetical protein
LLLKVKRLKQEQTNFFAYFFTENRKQKTILPPTTSISQNHLDDVSRVFIQEFVGLGCLGQGEALGDEVGWPQAV